MAEAGESDFSGRVAGDDGGAGVRDVGVGGAGDRGAGDRDVGVGRAGDRGVGVGGAGDRGEVMDRPVDLIRDAFGDRSGVAGKYFDWLRDQATVRGLIGPREAQRLWDRHILNGAAVGRLIGEGSTVADIGSGAGLPGIPLAISRPDLRVILVEPLLRRTTFLEEVVSDLSLPNVSVVRGRAEDKHVLSRVAGVDVATSRAVAPLGKLAAWSLPLVRKVGHMIAMKGSSAGEEIERDSRAIAKAKGGNPRVVLLEGGFVVTPTFAVVVDKR